MKIVLTGATGLIGRKLLQDLISKGHEVVALVRSPEKLSEIPSKNIFRWVDQQVPNHEIFQNCDAVIHLAGEGIADHRWTKERKEKIRLSRVHGTQNIVKSILSLDVKERPGVFISGSAIGYYSNSDEEQNESSVRGEGFLSNLCFDWEMAARPCEQAGIRTVLLRTGLVLAREGGLLTKSAPVILGDGHQWMSWIHIQDVIQLINLALHDQTIHGPLNLTAPNPVSNKEFTKVYAKLKKIPLTISVPSVMIKMITGELSQAILSHQKVLPMRALQAGFKFKFETIEEALKDLLVDLSRNKS